VAAWEAIGKRDGGGLIGPRDGSRERRALLARHNANLTYFGHMKPNDQPHSGPTHAAVNCFIALDERRSGRGTAEADNNGKGGVMLGSGERGSLRRLGADFALAFILFWAVALSLSAGQTPAHAVFLPALAKEAIQPDSGISSPASFRADQSSQAVHSAQTRPEQARLLLSVAFAAIIAFNLGFWRHLRRVYASPRRSVWRRG
jgi:hypothetical protein